MIDYLEGLFDPEDEENTTETGVWGLARPVGRRTDALGGGSEDRREDASQSDWVSEKLEERRVKTALDWATETGFDVAELEGSPREFSSLGGTPRSVSGVREPDAARWGAGEPEAARWGAGEPEAARWAGVTETAGRRVPEAPRDPSAMRHGTLDDGTSLTWVAQRRHGVETLERRAAAEPVKSPLELARRRYGLDAPVLLRAEQSHRAAIYAQRRREPVAIPVPMAASGARALDTAALDLVFQRDARRYDGGFSLY